MTKMMKKKLPSNQERSDARLYLAKERPLVLKVVAYAKTGTEPFVGLARNVQGFR
jgi:hypothetical protein